MASYFLPLTISTTKSASSPSEPKFLPSLILSCFFLQMFFKELASFCSIILLLNFEGKKPKWQLTFLHTTVDKMVIIIRSTPKSWKHLHRQLEIKRAPRWRFQFEPGQARASYCDCSSTPILSSRQLKPSGQSTSLPNLQLWIQIWQGAGLLTSTFLFDIRS